MTKPSSEKKEPFWNDDRKANLKKMWEDRVPRTKIAEFFGVTNNAIAGITDRMNLRRAHPNNGSAVAAAKKAAVNRKRLKDALKKAQAAKKQAVPQEAPKVETPVQAAPESPQPPIKAVETVKAVKPATPAKDEVVSLNPKSWVRRRVGECAYPIKETVVPIGWTPADQKSCCNETEEGQLYCDGHRKIMFEKPLPRGSRKKFVQMSPGSRRIG